VGLFAVMGTRIACARARKNGLRRQLVGLVYPKNLDKQEIAKLIVAQTVPALRVCADEDGAFYINNVRVNGIDPAQRVSLWYLLGMLNAPVADFVFRRIAAPKGGGYFEANKQFIAPLPIPDANAEDRGDIAARARRLQELNTRRRDLLAEIARRMGVVEIRARPDEWLFPDLPTIAHLEDTAPGQLDRAERRAWAREKRAEALLLRHEHLGGALRPGVSMDATFANGELVFLVDGTPLIDRIFLRDDEGAFVLAQWKLVASRFTVTESTSGKKFADTLRKVALTTAPGVREQIIERQVELSAVEADIAAAEAEMNARVYGLYGLTPDEIRLVEEG